MSESVAVIRLSGYSRSKMRDFSFEFLFRGICTEKSKYFALVKALFFGPLKCGNEKCVYRNVSVGLKCVSISNINLFANCSPLQTFMSCVAMV